MAIYHCSIKIIKRSAGRSAVAASAYRSGDKLTNEWDGMTHDYTRKSGVVHSEIVLPSHAPAAFSDRSTLWNSVEDIEKSGKAQLAREIEIALPVELDRQEQIELVRTYVRDTFVTTGMCADFAIHDKGDGNPHAHIMLTLRPLEPDGTWGAKCRKEYELDEQGHHTRLPSGEYKSRRVNTVDWNDRDKAEAWRSAWAEYANRALEQKGIAERIDHRSYERQGAEQIPTVHLGVAATQMELRGIATDKGNVNREIAAQNKLLKEIRARITRLHSWTKEQAAQPEGNASMMQIWQARQELPKSTTRYGKVKALKESAALLSFLQANNITSMQELHAKVDTMNSDYYTLRGDIRDVERRIAALTERLDHWQKYDEHKGVHRRLANIKPGKREAYMEAHRAELTLYDAADRYLSEFQKSGESIAPKEWHSDLRKITIQKDDLYRQMRAMREEVKAVENLRKAVQHLETKKSKEQEHER